MTVWEAEQKYNKTQDPKDLEVFNKIHWEEVKRNHVSNILEKKANYDRMERRYERAVNSEYVPGTTTKYQHLENKQFAEQDLITALRRAGRQVIDECQDELIFTQDICWF